MIFCNDNNDERNLELCELTNRTNRSLNNLLHRIFVN